MSIIQEKDAQTFVSLGSVVTAPTVAQTAVSGSAPRVLKRFAGAGGKFDQLRQCADALTDLRYRCVTEVESYAVRIFALG